MVLFFFTERCDKVVDTEKSRRKQTLTFQLLIYVMFFFLDHFVWVYSFSFKKAFLSQKKGRPFSPILLPIISDIFDTWFKCTFRLFVPVNMSIFDLIPPSYLCISLCGSLSLSLVSLSVALCLSYFSPSLSLFLSLYLSRPYSSSLGQSTSIYMSFYLSVYLSICVSIYRPRYCCIYYHIHVPIIQLSR